MSERAGSVIEDVKQIENGLTPMSDILVAGD